MSNDKFDLSSHDPLFAEVVEYVKGQKTLTASGVSRQFCIGFNRANRIIRQIEESGILENK